MLSTILATAFTDATASPAMAIQYLSVISAMANVVSCTDAPVCAKLNRLPCVQTPDTCGSCFNSDYIGDSGDANTPCFLPPSLFPTASPTLAPTSAPTLSPTITPTRAPTFPPTPSNKTLAPHKNATTHTNITHTNTTRHLSVADNDATTALSLALPHHGIHLLAAGGGGSTGGSGGGSGSGTISQQLPAGFCNATIPCNYALFQSCFNNICTVLSKSCYNNCGAPTAALAKASSNTSYGRCAYLSVESGRTLSDCKDGSTSCYATCVCPPKRGGLGCDLTADQLVSTWISTNTLLHPVHPFKDIHLLEEPPHHILVTLSTLSSHPLTTSSPFFYLLFLSSGK